MAGFAIRPSFTGHADRSAKINHELTSKLDHLMGADQFFFIVCAVIFFFARGMCAGGSHHWGPRAWNDPSQSALQILNERFARGEIQKEEYGERKTFILSGGQM